MTAALTLLGVGALTAPASAEPSDGLTMFLVQPDGAQQLNGAPVLRPNTDYELALRYEPSKLTLGASIRIPIDGPISIPDSSLIVPADNTGIASITRNPDGSLQVTMKDPIDTSRPAGAIAMKFKVIELEESVRTDISWTIGPVTTSAPVNVLAPGDEPLNVGAPGKSGGNGQLHQYVSVVDGVVVLAPAIADAVFPYTLTATTGAEASSASFTDSLPAGLELVPGSFAATLTSWDEGGLNKDVSHPAVAGHEGGVFAFAVEMPGNSKYELGYSARFTPTGVAELQAALQEQYDKVSAAGGSFAVDLKNSASISGSTYAASSWIGGNVAAPPTPGPDVKNVFGKAVNPTASEVNVNADGTLVAPVDLTYTLDADLTVWTGVDDAFTLHKDVIITDTLPAAAIWSADVVVVSVAGVPVPLTKVAGGRAGVESAGPLSYSLEGQTLVVNLGTDPVHYSIQAKAQATSVTGLWPNTPWGNPNAKDYGLVNTAAFDYGTGTADKQATTTLTDPGNTEGPVDNGQVFNKSAPQERQYVAVGETVSVPFTFVVNDWGSGTKAVDVSKSRIVDHIDHSTFNVTSADDVIVVVSPEQKPWGVTFERGADYTVELLSAGDVVIAWTEQGAAKLVTWGATQRLTATMTLTTKPLAKNQTLVITNSATLLGEDSATEYISSTTTEGYSYGGEIELRKSVYDPTKDGFGRSLRIGIDENGQLVNDEFVYRVQLIGHKYPSGIPTPGFADVLPEGVEFVGFVNDAATGAVVPGNSVTLRGNMTAVYDPATNTISLEDQAGKTFKNEAGIEVMFKVRVTEFKENVGITNVMTGTDATIIPSNEIPLSIEKRDAVDGEVRIQGGSFSILDSNDVEVLTGLTAVNGYLRTATGAVPTLAEAGSYTVREDVAPTGYFLPADNTTPLTVTDDGGVITLAIDNTPGAPQPEPVGTFSVAKVVEGVEGELPADLTFSVVCRWRAPRS